jgi:hypothetical protein
MGSDPQEMLQAAYKREWKEDPRTTEMFLVLLKCRDALPAITNERLKLYNVPADLDKQIEKCIEPWKLPPGTPGGI